MKSLEERETLFAKEYLEIGKWLAAESDRISADLIKRGAVMGLDTNREAYKNMHKEFRHKVLALYDKYDLPNKPNLE